MRDWSQIGRIRLEEKPVIEDRSNYIVARPVPESDYAAERDVPASVQGDRRQLDSARVVMQDADDPLFPRFPYHRGRIVVGVSRVHDDWPMISLRQFKLRRKGASLLLSGRIVVVVIQAAFSDRNCTGVEQAFQRGQIIAWIESGGVVGMDSRGKRDKARMRFRDPGRGLRLLDGCTDADYPFDARIASATDYDLAVAVEGLVRKVGVAVEESFHTGTAFLRGYLCSIQSNTGPAM